jgi:hypothetical protein
MGLKTLESTITVLKEIIAARFLKGKFNCLGRKCIYSKCSPCCLVDKYSIQFKTRPKKV